MWSHLNSTLHNLTKHEVGESLISCRMINTKHLTPLLATIEHYANSDF